MRFFLCCLLLLGVVEARAAEVRVVATTGMIADLVRRVGGERVEVVQLMGAGVDPHLYKATTRDAAALLRADVIFYSGLKLEGRMTEVLAKLGGAGRAVYAVTEAMDREQLLAPAAFEGHYDPHVWFDVSLWAQTVPVMVRGLSAVDAAGAEQYARRGAELQLELEALHAWVQAEVSQIPPKNRVLITSHDAFNYFGRAYGLRVVGLQGVSTVSEAALGDVASLVDFIRAQGVRAIFVESTVNPEAMRRVAKDAGVRIGGELFSDAMGAPGEMRFGWDTGTYEGMVRANVETVVEALK